MHSPYSESPEQVEARKRRILAFQIVGESVNGYLLVTDRSYGYVYAGRFEHDHTARTAEFFRDGKSCLKAVDVIAIVDTTETPIS